MLVFGGLVRVDENLKFQGELAERWESSEDLKTWTFYLRKGVKFHHGKELGLGRRHRHLQAWWPIPATGSSARTHMDLVESFERGGQVHGALQAEDSLRGLRRADGRAAAQDRSGRPPRQARHRAQRHRPVQVQVLHARRQAGAGEAHRATTRRGCRSSTAWCSASCRRTRRGLPRSRRATSTWCGTCRWSPSTS